MNALEGKGVSSDSRRTNFCRELDDALVRPDDLLAHEQLLDGDLRLDILRKLVQRVNGPILTVQGDDDVVRSATSR